MNTIDVVESHHKAQYERPKSLDKVAQAYATWQKCVGSLQVLLVVIVTGVCAEIYRFSDELYGHHGRHPVEWGYKGDVIIKNKAL